jgi:hypothetical protein
MSFTSTTRVRLRVTKDGNLEMLVGAKRSDPHFHETPGDKVWCEGCGVVTRWVPAEGLVRQLVEASGFTFYPLDRFDVEFGINQLPEADLADRILRRAMFEAEGGTNVSLADPQIRRRLTWLLDGLSCFATHRDTDFGPSEMGELVAMLRDLLDLRHWRTEEEREELAQYRGHVLRARDQPSPLDEAYRQRDLAVCLAARLAAFAGIRAGHFLDQVGEPPLRGVVRIGLPTGVVAWHIREAFAGVPEAHEGTFTGGDPSREEGDRRIKEFLTSGSPFVPRGDGTADDPSPNGLAHVLARGLRTGPWVAPELALLIATPEFKNLARRWLEQTPGHPNGLGAPT